MIRKRRGFSLVELLVVISIIAMFASIITPFFLKSTYESKTKPFEISTILIISQTEISDEYLTVRGSPVSVDEDGDIIPIPSASSIEVYPLTLASADKIQIGKCYKIVTSGKKTQLGKILDLVSTVSECYGEILTKDQKDEKARTKLEADDSGSLF